MNDDSRNLQLFHLLRRFSVAFELSRVEFARLHDLHPTDLRALIALLDAGRAGLRPTPGWLGAQLRLNSAGTTTLIDRLERLGHVQRVRDTQDRRKVYLEVTTQAVDLGWSFFGPLINSAVTEMRAFDAPEIGTIERFLNDMTRVVEANTPVTEAGVS